MEKDCSTCCFNFKGLPPCANCDDTLSNYKPVLQKCTCKFCTNYELYKWAVVMECKCGCHESDGISGHEYLCCEFPNALKKNNPHKNLQPAAYYLNIIAETEEQL